MERCFMISSKGARLSRISSRPSHPRQGVVHRHYVELLRLEAPHRAVQGRRASSPTYIVFVLFMAGFENDLKEFLISGHASDVLRRAVAFTGSANGPNRSRCRQNLFE